MDKITTIGEAKVFLNGSQCHTKNSIDFFSQNPYIHITSNESNGQEKIVFITEIKKKDSVPILNTKIFDFIPHIGIRIGIRDNTEMVYLMHEMRTAKLFNFWDDDRAPKNTIDAWLKKHAEIVKNDLTQETKKC